MSPILRCTAAALAVAIAADTAVLNSTAAGQQLPTVREVVDFIDDLYRSTSSHSIMTMRVVRDRGVRELTVEGWSIGDDQALLVIREPAREAGTATLRTRDGLWNYAPRADRLIRIPAGLLSDNWMGSHFTNDDLLRETSYLDDHRAEIEFTTEEGVRYLKVTLVPEADAPVVYTRLVFFVDPERWIPRRAEYFDEDELVRWMAFDRIQTIAGRPIPMRMILQPSDDPAERTEVIYDALELNVPVDETLFTRRGLRRVARN